MIEVRGDSMAPLLGDGDEILVDESDAGGRIRDGVYVLRRDGALMVKRLSPHPGGRRVSVTSDNRLIRAGRTARRRRWTWWAG
jgi:phage repressor protein C with HTH and peptisase S24 domain